MGANTTFTSAWFRRVAEATSEEAALLLIRHFGGTSIYVPITLEGHRGRLLDLLGLRDFNRLRLTFGGEALDVPMVGRRTSLKAAILAEEGTSRAVALRVGASQRYVKKVRAELRDLTESP